MSAIDPKPAPRSRRHRAWVRAACLIAAAVWSMPTVAAQDKHKDLVDELFEMPFDQLMSVEVFSVTRTAGQDWFTAPAAIYVITPEDMARSGHQSMPELLRMVPGMHVAQVDASTWAISSRGFNGRFNPYQLVQLDGRTLYTPVFAGVIWEMQDTVLQDLESVEVIRGPGGSLWGANAVNGVINFTTQSAKNTQGWLIDVGVGSEWRSTETVRYGGQLADGVFFRLYGKHSDHDDFKDGPIAYSDDWHRQQGGFRIDWENQPDQTFTLQGDVFNGHFGTSVRNPNPPAGTIPNVDGIEKYSGWNILGRLNQTLGPDEHTQLQVYYDFTEGAFPDEEGTGMSVGQVDVDFQHDFVTPDHHRIVWGLNYRRVNFHGTDGNLVTFSDNNRSLNTYGAFIQDTIELEKDRWSLIVGTKLEENDVTGFEYQPSARLVHTPDDKHTWWASVSRAVQVPAIGSQDTTITTAFVAPNTPVVVAGSRDLDATRLIAYETGYRVKPSDALTIDLATFFNDYEDILTATGPGLTLTQGNGGAAESYGAEVVVSWEAADNWRLTGTYTHLRQNNEGSLGDALARNNPNHQFSFRSYLDLTQDLSLNTLLYYTEGTDSSTNGSVDIPSHIRLDTGLVWQVDENFELSLWGQNLTDSSHPEFGGDGFVSNGYTEVERSVLLKATWKF